MTKARYEYEKAKIDEEAERNKGFSLGENQTRWEWNAETGKYEQIAAGQGNELDDAYRQKQIENLESQINERDEKAGDKGKYNIGEKERNLLRGRGWEESYIDELETAIRQYGASTIFNQPGQSDEIKDAIELILDAQGKLGT
jgi:hypothetical protein